MTGTCSTCSLKFANAQEFYEHLDDCVLRVVQQVDPQDAVNASHLASVDDDENVKEMLTMQCPPANSVPMEADDAETDDNTLDGADVDMSDTDGNDDSGQPNMAEDGEGQRPHGTEDEKGSTSSSARRTAATDRSSGRTSGRGSIKSYKREVDPA